MEGLTNEIRDVVDNYKTSNGALRLLIAADAMQRLFIAERIWKKINYIDMEEERIKGGME